MVDLGGAPAPRVAAAVAAAGLTVVAGDGVELALAGRNADRDAVELAAVLADAQRAFGELHCSDATASARQAIGLAAARQAAGLPAPELARAWTYLLLCADRDGQLDAALVAAGRLRALGGSPDVPAALWAKYPGIDAVANAELVELDIDTETPGAAIWIDSQPAGSSPVHVVLPAGEHVIAAAGGGQRGWAAGTAVRSQRSLRVPLRDPAGAWSDVARRVTGWNGELPSPGELAWLFGRVNARVAVVRHGDSVEAWGQVGASETPHRLAGPAPVGEAERVARELAGAVAAWDAHAPDPDLPLLVESRGARTDPAAAPTKWWVYAAIAAAATVGAVVVFSHDLGSDRQRVELRYP